MANDLATPLAAMPAGIVAGDSLKVAFTDLAADYPSGDGYAVTVLFVPIAGGVAATISCTGGASSWLLSVPAATTAGWPKGDSRWAVRVSKAGDVVTALQGQIAVAPNPASDNVDSRTHARRVLDAIDAAIEGRASKTDLKTTFEDGRSIERLSHMELLKMRDAYVAKVRAEERRAQGKGPARVLMQL